MATEVAKAHRITTSRWRPSMLLNDAYQLTMAYAYWRSGKHEDEAVFEYFFRTPPFGGEFTVFGGLADFLDVVQNFRFGAETIEYLKHGTFVTKEECAEEFEAGLLYGNIRPTAAGGFEKLALTVRAGSGDEVVDWVPATYPTDGRWVPGLLAGCEPDFFDWLATVDCSRVQIYTMREGTMVFPKEPIVRVKGPLAITQLLETPVLYALNFPTLMMTNAVRYRLAAGWHKRMLEFGLRRAQSDRASFYAWQGGFDGTSNVDAALRLGITASGTLAHSLIEAFTSLDDLEKPMLNDAAGVPGNFVEAVLAIRKELGYESTNEGELAAMIGFALAFPRRFLPIVDTYNTLTSGVPNFICVARALDRFGYQPLGVRIDSGDLAYLSLETRKLFAASDAFYAKALLENATIVVSNDIDEAAIRAFNRQPNEITDMGIGTHLATCKAQPALGGVYKLVAVNGRSKIKLSNEWGKVSIPGEKAVYRLVLENGLAYVDLMRDVKAPAPRPRVGILCRDPFDERKRVKVEPAHVIALHDLIWDGRMTRPLPSPADVRVYVWQQVQSMRPDHLRELNPTPYKVSVDDALYEETHRMLLEESPVAVVR
jgi:nicotinate phosphoribosyltransferase